MTLTKNIKIDTSALNITPPGRLERGGECKRLS
jgi:hypothetical protein